MQNESPRTKQMARHLLQLPLLHHRHEIHGAVRGVSFHSDPCLCSHSNNKARPQLLACREYSDSVAVPPLVVNLVAYDIPRGQVQEVER